MIVYYATHGLVWAAVALLVLAALTDLHALTIPNWLVLGLAGLYVLLRIVAFDLGAVTTDLTAAAMVFAFCFACFCFGWLGGGDAKLATVAALWVGLGSLAGFVVVTTMSGAILALALLAVRRWLPSVSDREGGGAVTPAFLERGAPVPYGVAISVGAIAAMLA